MTQIKKGRLTIVGCGLHPGHMTLETQGYIQAADKVLVVAPNPLSIQHIIQLNSSAENLGRFYDDSITRLKTYHLMANYMVDLVKQGLNVCTVFYGHPGIFVLSTRIAQEALTKSGYDVKMLPGISADACLFADLQLDPSSTGCQSFESTQFLMTKREFDTGAALILWQIGLVGEHTLKSKSPGKKGLYAIAQLLKQHYPKAHKICLYEAPTLPGFQPRKDWITIDQLENVSVKPITTLYVPALTELVFAEERLNWLELTKKDFSAWKEEVEVVEEV